MSIFRERLNIGRRYIMVELRSWFVSRTDPSEEEFSA